MEHNPKLDLVIQRELKASRAQLWKAWTIAELLAQWWAPKPWQAQVVALDVRPMGAFSVAMMGPDGERFEGPGAFLHVEHQRCIIWTSALDEGWRPVDKPDFPFTATITMDDHGSGSRYTAHVQHPTPELRQQHEQMGFMEGWNTCISQLDELALGLEEA